jgi:hypothetical protein
MDAIRRSTVRKQGEGPLIRPIMRPNRRPVMFPETSMALHELTRSGACWPYQPEWGVRNMSLGFSALILEGICSATGADRQRVSDALEDLQNSLSDRTNEVARRVSTLMASSDSAAAKFEATADYGQSVVPMDVKSKLFAALGLSVVGGLVWTMGAGLLGTLVAIALFLVAGYLAMSVVRYALGELKNQLAAFNASN